jgi:hypothetical protein
MIGDLVAMTNLASNKSSNHVSMAAGEAFTARVAFKGDKATARAKANNQGIYITN